MFNLLFMTVVSWFKPAQAVLSDHGQPQVRPWRSSRIQSAHKLTVAAVFRVCCSILLLGSCADEPSATHTDSKSNAPTTQALQPEVFATTLPVEVRPLQTPTTVLVLGDSISAAYGIQREQGWVALLEAHLKHYGKEHRVVNASASGETTGGGLARLPAVLAEHQPDLVIVELGGNDGLRGYPATRIHENLSTIIETAKASGAQVLLVGMQIPPNYGPRYTQAFAQTFRSLAQEHQIELVPSFLEEIALAGNLMQADGIHPKAAAQPMLLDAIWPALATFLETRR